jgi:predicted HAD superfamily Cof-like phosphohydrolase
MMPHTHVSREQKVARFHRAMGLDIDSDPRVSLLGSRKSLIKEETNEACDILSELEMELERGKKGSLNQWAHCMKEMCDLQYVVSGTIISLHPIYGNFIPAFNRVHYSNMSKLDNEGKPLYDSNGKVLKGPNYKPPDLTDLVEGVYV